MALRPDDLWLPDKEDEPRTAKGSIAWSEEELGSLAWWVEGADPLPMVVEDVAAWRVIEGKDPRTGRRAKGANDPRSDTVQRCAKAVRSNVDRATGEVQKGKNWCKTPSKCRSCGRWWASSRAAVLRLILSRHSRVYGARVLTTERGAIDQALKRAQKREDFGAAVVAHSGHTYVLSTHPLTGGSDHFELDRGTALEWFVTHAMVTPHFVGGKWLRGSWKDNAPTRPTSGALHSGIFSSDERVDRAEERARWEGADVTPEDLATRILVISFEDDA